MISNTHAKLLSTAMERVLSGPEQGAISFVRCLNPGIVKELALDTNFSPGGWLVRRVTDEEDGKRSISADQAVEMREDKKEPILLLVDTSTAGAGMDGIYSAAQEIGESTLFNEARRQALRELEERIPGETGSNADLAIRTARGYGNQFNISPWAEFDFIVTVMEQQRNPGELLDRLGLWPIKLNLENNLSQEQLDRSRYMVERLLGMGSNGLVPSQRIDGLGVVSEEQIQELERFLRDASNLPVNKALELLSNKPELWINSLQVEADLTKIQNVELTRWRSGNGRLAQWTGLSNPVPPESPDSPPFLYLDPEPTNTGNYTRFDVRWTTVPSEIPAGSVDYRIAIMTNLDEEIAYRDVTHTAGRFQKCRFTDDDFSFLNEDALIPARVELTVVGSPGLGRHISEDFTIRFGDSASATPTGAGKTVRTLSDGLIEVNQRELVTKIASSNDPLSDDGKGYVAIRTENHRSFKVFRPHLIRTIDDLWPQQSNVIGRWRLPVRASGAPAADLEFVPLSDAGVSPSTWDRVENASRRVASRFRARSGVGQVYDQDAGGTLVRDYRDYMVAWTSLLSEGDPSLALANTVEVHDQSGNSIGLIVLPSHPLRIAWHSAYDNLVIHSKFEQGQSANDIRKEFSVLDGSMFPPFLPGLKHGCTFVFSDTLGFHAVGMVLDTDKEPRASISILNRALGESETDDTSPTVGKQTGQVVGQEILKYIDAHQKSEALHIHAIRAGDGMEIAQALGHVQKQWSEVEEEDRTSDVDLVEPTPFVLELYPSLGRSGVAGRFLSEARQKRRAGSGILADNDRWMLESISKPGGINVPKLRWAKMESESPESAAHLSIAFDTFESRVIANQEEPATRPYFAYGLLSYFERSYTSSPSPYWQSSPILSGIGEKHPAGRVHTDRLIDLQKAIGLCVSRSLGNGTTYPQVMTEITPEKAEALRELHSICDWVLTIDRNSGIEFFDSPHDEGDRYDSYVIDCVPEREDMGSLQLVTSTSDLGEVRRLVDIALGQMGLSSSRRNAEFLLNRLKALSGRLAMRLTSGKDSGAATSELIALAMSQAHCEVDPENKIWVPLGEGFLVPVDDVIDLLPPYTDIQTEEESDAPLPSHRNVRPDLIYVSITPRRGLSFQFIEVKHRRHLRTARNPQLVSDILNQTEQLRERWTDWYFDETVPPAFRSMRLAKLARVLRFYADKAKRHHLDDGKHAAIATEIDKMIERGAEYRFGGVAASDRGWIFCPEFFQREPELVSQPNSPTQIFLFGPDPLLPDSGSDLASEIQSTTLEQVEQVEDQTDSVHPETSSTDPTICEQSSESDPLPVRPPELKVEDAITNPEPSIEPEPLAGSGENSSPITRTNPADDSGSKSGPQECVVVLGNDAFTGSEVSWRLTLQGNPHLLVAGLPGMGKTTLLLQACVEMLKSGVRPIVFSYHEDFDEKLQELVPDVRFVDFDGLGFNPLQVLDRNSKLAYLDVAGAVRDIFSAIFPDLGDLQCDRIRTAIKQSFVEKGWDDSGKDLTTLEEPTFGRFVEILKGNPKPDRGLQGLLARIGELDDYGLFNVSPSEQSMWDSERPIVIRIHHNTQNDVLQNAFASMVFYGLYKDMFRRGVQQRITHSIIFDEAHRAARMKLIPTMAKECRKYGIALLLASQEAKDFNDSLFSAIANYLALRLNETDAKAFVRNVSSSNQERSLVDRIKQMERFRALYFSEGQRNASLVLLKDITE